MLDNQQLATSILIAIDSGLLMLMNVKVYIEKLILVQRLNDAANLVTQIHHNERNSKRAFILPGISKKIKSVVNLNINQKNFYLEPVGQNKRSLSNRKIIPKCKESTSNKATQPNVKQNINYKSLLARRPLTSQTASSNNRGQSSSRILFRPTGNNTTQRDRVIESPSPRAKPNKRTYLCQIKILLVGLARNNSRQACPELRSRLQNNISFEGSPGTSSKSES